MHEFSLCEGIIKQVLKQKTILPEDIVSINIAIGELAGVDIDSLQFWFPVVAAKFQLADVKLKIDIIPARVICKSCNTEFHLQKLFDPCPVCSAYANYDFLSGRELLVKSVSAK
ncbi:hydrogenase maturation nickel metallochaperone HypA [Aquella oligotrophica]|uniref:Hydrogenase maturation factor HypA n=1 Tax=Aquella oligotrophica TaxID=2067065 RepID=A0A2I7N3Z1_9NEIS|nr:hydrogenase maturation nickel metallochaperone HypA [Aquella oligotrophica]AUR51172.1 hydrogenase maturation nickel metallochaperone HypA [Aquella oligotrophica]